MNTRSNKVCFSIEDAIVEEEKLAKVGVSVKELFDHAVEAD